MASALGVRAPGSAPSSSSSSSSSSSRAGLAMRVAVPSIPRPQQQQQQQSRAASLVPRATGPFDVSVRPYTLRKGDTLETIAKKRDLSIPQIKSINPDLKDVGEGQTILLPAGKLSSRDKEILGGIGTTYRLYPVRRGESFADVAGKRGITRAEMAALNAGANLDRLKEGQLLKLPANKFTVREREMLIGSGILPPEFFRQAMGNPFALGVGALLFVCGGVLVWQRLYDEDAADEAAARAEEEEGLA